jgi:multiple sugar transport system substrate-binding protein
MKNFCLFCLLLLCCVGCGPSEERGSITFMVFGDPAELAAYQRLVEAFEAQHPEIDVELGHVPGQQDYRQRLAADFSTGEPPDVMLLNYRRFAQFAASGGLAPLGPYLAQSDLLHEPDFYAPTLESFTFDGQLWCIPQNISSLVVYYNRDLFDAAGLAYPTGDWTRDDFVALARALTRDLDGDGQIDQYGAGLSPNLFRLAPFVWQDGGELVDDPANPTRLTLDSPATLAAFQWFVDLQVKEGVVPDAVAEVAESSESRFLNGRTAMYFNSRRGVPTYRTITTFQWDVAPLPNGPRPSGILHSDGYCLAAKTQDKAAAWTFIEFANSAEGQRLVAATGRTVPSLIEVAESPAFLDPDQPPANSRVFLDTIPQLGRVPLLSTWPAVEETASREIERAFYGQASVEEAAAAAVSLTQPYFDRAASGR